LPNDEAELREASKASRVDFAVILSASYLPPAVELPGGAGFASFVPGTLVGVYSTRQEALRAAVAAGALAARPRGSPVTFGPHGRSFPFGPHKSYGLTCAEGASLATAIARHHKPLAADAPATDAAYYQALRPPTLPLAWRGRRDVLIITPRGGGEDFTGELTLGRVEAMAPPAIQVVPASAMDVTSLLSGADLLELDHRIGRNSPTPQDAIRYGSLAMRLQRELPDAAAHQQYKDAIRTLTREEAFRAHAGREGVALSLLRAFGAGVAVGEARLRAIRAEMGL
jgi:hypothetical protein